MHMKANVFRRKAFGRILSWFLVLTMLFGIMIPGAAAVDTAAGASVYDDIAGHWAEELTMRWSSYGLVSGYNGKFRPDAPITRGESAQIISQLLGLSKRAENTFADLSASDWQADPVLKCVQAGYLAGSGGNVNASRNITRQEAMALLGRALQVEPDASPDLSRFRDGGRVDDWAAGMISAMAKRGMVSGKSGGLLDPQALLTRAEILAMLNTVSTYINKPGEYALNGGIAIVASKGVKLTGSADVLIVAQGAGAGDLTLNGVTCGSMAVSADHIDILLSGGSRVTGIDVTKGTVGVDITIEKNSSAGNINREPDTQVHQPDEPETPENKEEDKKPAGSIGGGSSGGGNRPKPTPTPDPTPEPEEPAIFALNFTSYPMPLGSGIAALTPVIGDGYSGEIEWSVEDPEIAGIRADSDSQDGAVYETKATGVTNAVATLKADNGETYTAKCQLVVIDPYDETTPLYVQLNTNRLRLAPGQSAGLKNFIYPEQVLTDLSLKGTLDTRVTYTSEDPSVATVDGAGNVTAVGAAGSKTTITVETAVSGRKDICEVEIVEAAGPAPAAVGGAFTMTVGEIKALASAFGTDVQWTSSNPFIACVDASGKVTAQSRSSSLFALGSGRADVRSDPDKQTVEVYATSASGAVETFTVKVEPEAAQPVSVHVNKSEIVIPAGDTRSITAVVAPAYILNNNGEYVSWTSSNSGVVSVERHAANVFGADEVVLRGNSAGTATVTASTANGRKATCTVRVTDGALQVSSIGLESSKTIAIDQALPLQYHVNSDAADPTLIWLCPDRTVATVDREGNVMGYQEGRVEIYAFAKDSLTNEQRETLAELGELRQIAGADAEQLDELLASKNVVYDACALTVANESIYLRNLHAPEEAVTANSVNLLWNRASLYYAEDFDHYEVTVNGKKNAETEKLGHTVKGLSPSTRYTFRVEVYLKGQSHPEHAETVTVTTKAAGKVLDVMDYGAAGDGSTLDTYAIQSAIDAAKAGDTVLLPEGRIFRSGALFLKSDMTFQVDGLLLGSSDSKDYPLMVTRFECWRKIDNDNWENAFTKNGATSKNQYAHSSLLNAGVYDEGDPGYTGPYNLHDLVICGKGQINGNGFTLANNEGTVGKGTSNKVDGMVRGRLISIHNADGVYIEGVTLAFGPAWTTHVIFSRNVTLDNIKVISTNGAELLNGDALDPDSTFYLNLFNSFLMPGDDSVAIKSGRGQEGVDVDRPSAYIRVTDCRSGLASTAAGQRPKGGYSIGSEEGGGVHDVLFQNLYMDGAGDSHGLWIKAYACRSGLVEDIAYRDATVMNTMPKSSKNSLSIQINHGVQESDQGHANLANRFARVRRVAYENITVDYNVKIDGQPAAVIADYGNETPASYVEDVVFRGLNIVPHAVSDQSWYNPKPNKNSLGKVMINYARDITFENGSYAADNYLADAQPHPLAFTQLDHSENIVIDNQSLTAVSEQLTVSNPLTVHNDDGSLTYGEGRVTVNAAGGPVSVASILDGTAVRHSEQVSVSVWKAGNQVAEGDLESGMTIRLTNDVNGTAGSFDYTVTVEGEYPADLAEEPEDPDAEATEPPTDSGSEAADPDASKPDPEKPSETPKDPEVPENPDEADEASKDPAPKPEEPAETPATPETEGTEPSEESESSEAPTATTGGTTAETSAPSVEAGE